MINLLKLEKVTSIAFAIFLSSTVLTGCGGEGNTQDTSRINQSLVATNDGIIKSAQNRAIPLTGIKGNVANDTTIVLDELKAFPTAMGAGASVTGGRGGVVKWVTTTNPTGAGSFKEVLEDGLNNKTIMFAVGGSFPHNYHGYTDDMRNVTIAGQTASALGGFHIDNSGNNEHFFYMNSTNTVWRYISIRGNRIPPDYNGDPILYTHGNGNIFDHVTDYGGNSSSGPFSGVGNTIQYNLATETNNSNTQNTGYQTFNRDYRGEAGFSDFVYNVSILKSHRIPAVSGSALNKFRVVNNYNYGWGTRHMVLYGSPIVDTYNNVFEEQEEWANWNHTKGDTYSLYTSDSYADGAVNGTYYFNNEWHRKHDFTELFTINNNNIEFQQEESYAAINLVNKQLADVPYLVSLLDDPQAVKNYTLSNAGAGARYAANSVVTNVYPWEVTYINYAKNGNETGTKESRYSRTPIAEQSKSLTSFERNQGFPESWAQLHGLDVNNSTIRNGVKTNWSIQGYTVINNAGYTNLEIYLAELAGDFHMLASSNIGVEPNHAPVANSASVIFDEDTQNNTIQLTGTDVDGDTLSYIVVSNPSHGSLAGTAPNLRYTPNANYFGSDSFTFKVSDGKVTSQVATVSIAITDVAEPPTGSPVIYEDGEDQNTNGWQVYDQSPSGATITNVYDSDSNSRVIQLTGDRRNNGFRLGHTNANHASAWKNTTQKVISWDVKSNEPVSIFIATQTTLGFRYMYYTTRNTDLGILGGNNNYIHHGIGLNLINGQWHTVTRDLEADLQEFEPNNEILSVNGFLMRGSVRVDNIALLNNLPPPPLEVVYEDAENSNIDGWDIYDQNPSGAIISNVSDAESNSRVIELTGTARQNGFRLGHNSVNHVKAWNDIDRKIISWDSKLSKPVSFFVATQTTLGFRYLYYTTSNADLGILGRNNNYIHHGLGRHLMDGAWHTITRNLQTDLQEFEPANRIISVNGLLVRGSGRLDNIKLASVELPSITPVGHWSMDETSGSVLHDMSGNNQNITLSAVDSSTYVRGQINGGVAFNGSRDGVISNAGSLKPTSVTIGSFVKTTTTGTWQWVAAHGDNYGLYISDTGKAQFYYFAGNNTWHAILGTSNINDGRWHHLAGSFDHASKTMKVYVDGVLEKEQSFTNGINYSHGSDFHIGTMNGYRNFIGTLDDLKLFDVALTEQEVRDLGSITDEPNHAPVANRQSVTVNEDTQNNAIQLTATDADGDTLSYTVVSSPSHGSLTGTAPDLKYTPNSNYYGSDYFTFRVNDGKTSSQVSRVSITINNVAEPPSITSVGHWSMDETSGSVLHDMSGNNQNITLSAVDNSTYVRGKINGGVAFNGNRDGVISSAGSLKPTSVTIASFVKTTTTGTWQWIAAHGDNYGLYISDTGKVQFYYFAGSNTWNAILGTSNINDGRWHHLAGSFDHASKTIKVYVDGVLEKEQSFTNGINYSHGSDFHIGTMNGYRNFIGTLDDLKLFDVALTEQEVRDLGSITDEPNHAPVANRQSVTINENTQNNAIQLTGTDADGDTLSYTAVSRPLHGSLTGTAPNLKYTPNSNYYGSDSFTFKVSDGKVTSRSATVSITVRRVIIGGTFTDRVVAEKATFATIENVKANAISNKNSYDRPLLISRNNQEISDQTIYADRNDSYAIRCNGKTGIKLRNLVIYHANIGIDVNNCNGIEISNVKLISLAAPQQGPHCVRGSGDGLSTGMCLSSRNTPVADTRLAISISDSDDINVTNIQSQQASSALYIRNSNRAKVREIIGFDMRGPFPRGQLVQFNNSPNFLLEDFSYTGVFNQSHAEDNVNAYKSNGGTIKRGVIDGNWSTNGVGVIADSGSSNIEISDIDCNHIATSCVNVWSNSALSNNIMIRNIRSKNGTLISRHGGRPSTGGLVIAAQPGTRNITFNSVLYINPARSYVAYAPDAIIKNLREAMRDFELRW